MTKKDRRTDRLCFQEEWKNVLGSQLVGMAERCYKIKDMRNIVFMLHSFSGSCSSIVSIVSRARRCLWLVRRDSVDLQLREVSGLRQTLALMQLYDLYALHSFR